MLDYYGHHLGITLRRPLVIASLPGGRGDDIAYAIASLTGVAVHHIDEQLMHRLGEGLAQSVTRLGLNALQHRKSEALDRVLKRQPIPIIALGDVSLLTESTWTQLQSDADVVSILWSNLELLSRLQQPTPAMKRQYWQLTDSISHLVDIPYRFDQQTARLQACKHPLNGQGRTALTLAQAIIDHLQLDPEDQR